MTKTFKEVIAGIRTAIYGREVREDIAQMGEYVEQFANTATTKASEAASSATAAKNSQTAAKTSETNSAASQKAAASSASAAASSASAAKTSETNAGKSQQAAASSASAAASSATAAKSSETAAASAASAAKQSETNAASSAAAAAKSQTAAATSEKNAAASKTDAEQALKDTKQAKTDALTDISSARGTALRDISTARSTALSDLSSAEETALSNVADATKTSTANAAAAAQKAADAAQSAADALAHQQAAATSESNAASSASAAKASEERAAELTSDRVAWDNITGKPEAYPPSSHTHTKSQITDFPSSMPASDVPAWAKAPSKPSYAWGEITGKPSTFAPASHTHTKSQITDFPSLGNASGKNVRSLSAQGSSGWANQGTDDGYVPTMAFMAFWNGAYASSGASNLLYCDRGRFGTIVTKESGDYAAANHSHAWSAITGKPSTFTPASHTHNYAGSGSAGGSANSAAKLDSSAGSATQPVYFSGGKPVACSYTLGKSVPSNAVFTDTNTWRGIQNNLTSTATDQSLSAAQGKWLNENKAASNHSHSAGTTGAFSGVQASGSNYVRFTDGTQICWNTFAPGAAGNYIWTYSVRFSSTPTVLWQYVSSSSIMSPGYTYMHTVTTSQANLYANLSNAQYAMIAIGRWK